MIDVNSSGITLCTPHLNLFTLNRPEARTILHCLYWFGNHTLWLPYLWAMIVRHPLVFTFMPLVFCATGDNLLNMLWLHFFISKLGAILSSWDCYEDTLISIDKQRISWGEWEIHEKYSYNSYYDSTFCSYVQGIYTVAQNGWSLPEW